MQGQILGEKGVAPYGEHKFSGIYDEIAPTALAYMRLREFCNKQLEALEGMKAPNDQEEEETECEE